MVIVSSVAALSYPGPQDTDASVIVGNDYKSIEITALNASNTAPIRVKTGAGSLGSVVVASSSVAGYIKIYDGAFSTSSATTTRIVQFPPSAAPMTYVFDREITRGLLIEAPAGFDGSVVVTYR